MITELILFICLGFVVSFLSYNYYVKKSALDLEEEPEIRLNVNIPKMVQQLINGLQKPETITYTPIQVERSETKINTPLKGSCSNCKKEISLPFKCKYCVNLFCEDHRLPENHICEGI